MPLHHDRIHLILIQPTTNTASRTTGNRAGVTCPVGDTRRGPTRAKSATAAYAA